MAKKTATHTGTCQMCSRSQKLPGGLLSLHGYQVQYSSFQGVCAGAGYRPYEETCDDIREVFIPMVERMIETHLKDIEALRTPTTVNSLYKNIRPGQRYQMTELVHIEVTLADYSFGQGIESAWLVADSDGFKKRSSAIYSLKVTAEDTPETVALKIVDTYRNGTADEVQREVNSLKGWVKAQQKRVDDWKPRTLKAIDTAPKPLNTKPCQEIVQRYSERLERNTRTACGKTEAEHVPTMHRYRSRRKSWRSM